MKDEEMSDDYEVHDQKMNTIMEEAAATFSEIFTPAPTTAETILFPIQDEVSSDEEESDWIVSSDDDEEENMAAVLAHLRKPAQPIMYHFEAGCRETEQCIMEDDGEESSIKDGLIELDILLPLHGILLESGAEQKREVERDGENESQGEMRKEEGREGEGEGEEEGEGEGEGEGEVAKEDTSIVAKLRKVLPDMKDQLEATDVRGELNRKLYFVAS